MINENERQNQGSQQGQPGPGNPKQGNPQGGNPQGGEKQTSPQDNKSDK